MIGLEQVSFGYGEKQETLSQVSATVARGECVLLCGASGLRKDHSDEADQRPDPGFYSRMPSGGTGDGKRACAAGNTHA